MPEIHDTGNPEPTVSQDESVDTDWEQEGEETDEVAALPDDLLAKVADQLGLVQDEAETIGEERLNMLLKKVEPAKETKPTPKPAAKPRRTVKDLKMDDDFDPRIVSVLQDSHKNLQAIQAQLDELTTARVNDDMDILHTAIQAAGEKAGVSKADVNKAQQIVTALKAGYGDDAPATDELVDMALRSIGGTPVGTDRSDQFVSRPTHRNAKGGSTKETKTSKAIRNVKQIMQEHGMLD